MMPGVTIITVISGNNIEFMSVCLLSLIESTAYSNLEIIIVCDADATTRDYFSAIAVQYQHVRTVHRTHKSGNASNRNFGAAHATKEPGYYLFTDSDVVYTDRSWLNKLVSHLEKRRDVGMIGSGAGTALGHYCWIQPEKGLLVNSVMDFTGVIPDHPVEMMVIPGYNMLVRKDLFHHIGGWDEGFFPVYGEDIDLCLRFILAGFKVFSLHNPGVTHLYRDNDRNNSCERLPEENRLWLTVASCRRLALKYENILPSVPSRSYAEWLSVVEGLQVTGKMCSPVNETLPSTVAYGRLNPLFLPLQDPFEIGRIFDSIQFDY